MTPELLSRWQSLHPFEEDHPHVLGANFGIRGSAYLAAGGFPRHVSHEDRGFGAYLRTLGTDVALAPDT